MKLSALCFTLILSASTLSAAEPLQLIDEIEAAVDRIDKQSKAAYEEEVHEIKIRLHQLRAQLEQGRQTQSTKSSGTEFQRSHEALAKLRTNRENSTSPSPPELPQPSENGRTKSPGYASLPSDKLTVKEPPEGDSSFGHPHGDSKTVSEKLADLKTAVGPSEEEKQIESEKRQEQKEIRGEQRRNEKEQSKQEKQESVKKQQQEEGIKFLDRLIALREVLNNPPTQGLDQFKTAQGRKLRQLRGDILKSAVEENISPAHKKELIAEYDKILAVWKKLNSSTSKETD